MINKRARDAAKEPPCDNKSRLCKTNVEDVIHIISCCPFMPASYYLPMRYDMVAKTLYKEIIKKHIEIEVPKEINEQKYIQKEGDNECWWNLSINTVQKVPHNKSDLVIRNTKEKKCNIVEFSCPADTNITKKEKLSAYVPLVPNLHVMHPNYYYKIIPIVVGALGSIPKLLNGYLCQLGFNRLETKINICKMQSISGTGTGKMCKSFLKFL